MRARNISVITHISRRPWIRPKSEKRRKRETRKNIRWERAKPLDK